MSDEDIAASKGCYEPYMRYVSCGHEAIDEGQLYIDHCWLLGGNPVPENLA